MESTKAKKPTVLVVLALALVVASSLGIWAYWSLHSISLSKLVRSDLPMLDLRLQFIDTKGNEITPEKSRLAPGSEAADNAEKRPSVSIPQGCPELVGGDRAGQGELSAGNKKAADSCPKVAKWQVIRHPIAYTLYFRDGRKILSQFDENTQIKKLFETRFFQGLFHEPLHDASVRAEDLSLKGIRGAFMERFLREAVAAHGELHYDAAHGKKGFVFSFVRKECGFASKVLPVMAGALARSGYRIAALKEPVLEMRIGLQRVFLTQYKERVYISNGLEALLNVIESLPPPAHELPDSPLVFTTRAEAFLDKLLPLAVGSTDWDINLGFGLDSQASGSLEFSQAKFTKQLRAKIFKGVLASIPFDAFGAAAASFYLKPSMTDEDWVDLATNGPGDKPEEGPAEAGFAVIWDFSPEKGQVSNVGVIVANQKDPDEVESFKRYFANPELTAQCGGGTVFLAATSQKLLTRMKESCEGKSPSILNWEEGAGAKEYENSKLFLFLNPGSAMRQLTLEGTAKSKETDDYWDTESDIKPEWKQDYDKAMQAMLTDGEKVFSAVPIFAFSGSVPPESAQVVRLKEFTVKQGASR